MQYSRLVTFRSTPSPTYDLVCEVRDALAEMRPETKMRILGALNLTLDFDVIERSAGAPRFMRWYGAFGLMLSLIWVYVLVLRLLVLLRARQ